MEGITTIEIGKEILLNKDIVSILSDTGIFASKGEAKKMLAGGGVFINKEKVISLDEKINEGQLLNNRYLLIQKGKKNYYLISGI